MSTNAAEMSWDDIKALVAELAIQSKETDRKFQETERLLKERSEETDRKFQETRELLDRLSRRFGDLGNRLGEFVEAMVEPALVDLFRARGLDVSEVHRRVTSRRGGEAIEIDLLVVDGDTAVAVECKSRLTKEEVERHVERMNKFKRLLPKYADMRVHGAVAGMVVDEDAIQAAQAAGLWVLAQSGETVALKNDPGFAPRVW
ncbi:MULTISPECIES: hypothetical protein [Tepidimonas]|jgi:hypothetical protein|uniref:hypothetical protein n=1 Tax=Tepidimonas TaxID=114248 RepID=UPI0007345D16|nr:hypothetical protein [Tepidimonas taiwanensis]